MHLKSFKDILSKIFGTFYVFFTCLLYHILSRSCLSTCQHWKDASDDPIQKPQKVSIQRHEDL